MGIFLGVHMGKTKCDTATLNVVEVRLGLFVKIVESDVKVL